MAAAIAPEYTYLISTGTTAVEGLVNSTKILGVSPQYIVSGVVYILPTDID
jgi:hypothetical protein